MTRRAYLPRLDTIIVLHHAAATALAVLALGELAVVILDAVLVVIILDGGLYSLFGVVSYLVFYEVIARNSKIPGKMDANAKKIKAGTKNGWKKRL